MSLPVSAPLLEACVLAILEREDTYGYLITQRLVAATGVSESALYPVLRRLQKEGALETYDVAISGRNRRYYHLSPMGRALLRQYLEEWESYKSGLDEILRGDTAETNTEGGAGDDPR